jgi:hypothetical protein
VCATLQNLRDESVVFRDADWTATSVADAPGMVMLCTNAHDAGLASMTPSAAGSLGGLLAKLSGALVSGGEADRVALLHMGDRSLHTHLMLVARQGGGEPIADLGALEQRVKATRDAALAQQMVERLRSALA